MPMLSSLLSKMTGEAFAAAGLDPAFGTVTVSDRPDLCHFQCNGALAAAKAAKQPPRKIAEAVVEHLGNAAVFRDVGIAGPGFINLTLSEAFLAEQVSALVADPRLGVAARQTPRTIILDFGGPNIAKPMHVGHLRASIIGDCLQRLFRFAGERTVSDVHMGDWGLPMGMLISEIAERQPDLLYFDEAFEGPYPDDSPVTMADLEELYPAASRACKDDEARAARAREATAALQQGRPGYLALWKHFMAVSIAGMRREFGDLGVTFDLWKGESDVDPLLADMVDDLKTRSIAEESDGAWIVAVERDEDKADVPPLMLLKSDGSALYSTTDLATIIDRVREHNPDLMLYVVDQRQHLHFEQVFRAAHKAGLAGKAGLEHIGFGTMNGPDGKPFKTRAGGVLKLHDLISMAKEKALQRLEEAGLAADYSAEEREQVAAQVGIAAIKFADLSNWRLSNYIFDLDRFTSFEGKTGPYLQYAAVRIKSIFRKAALAPEAMTAPETMTASVRLTGPVEQDLALALLGFAPAVEQAMERRAPNVICDYAYSLAQAFSRFYAEHHILSETDQDLRAARLTLAALSLTTLTQALAILGITVPDRM